MVMVPVILCGGSGTRLWPVSRRYFPKQFHALTSGRSLFQETVLRCMAVPGAGEPVLMTGGDYRFLVSEQLDAVGVDRRSILLEPVPRDTAPSIALAALHVAESDPGAVMLVAPSDHVINDRPAFQTSIGAAVEAARRGRLVTLGIEPSYPATGYGYIKSAPGGEDELPPGCHRVASFVEKPDGARAAQFLAEGTYCWNSGMFLFTASAYLEEIARLAPSVLDACRRAWEETKTDFGFRTFGQAYQDAPPISVDYAVMESTDKSVVVLHAGDWNDIGSWSSLADINTPDERGNTVVGNVRLQDSVNSFVFASDRLVAGVGLENAIVVETKDAVLVSARRDDQQVRQLAEALKSEGAAEADFHTRVYRPWGSYEDLDKGEGFHVKRLVIKPGASISLQRHYHRCEHWVVVQGEASVIRDDEKYVLKKNESTYIPREAVHKLTNNGAEDLVIVEVQTGDYLDESDIERLKDDYGRS